ncbi:B-cell scaffold protein with ankyrin repeats-like isoform X3 [Littorina saxatilis]|uniref:B-cell scaffold protein with ankyrin repeats-like isoform X3 n=1 Tax=Littorina saxatilis TaxID=31220 RepID=UPI0038B56D9E
MWNPLCEKKKKSSEKKDKDKEVYDGRRKSSYGQNVFATMRNKYDKMIKRKSKQLTRSTSMLVISQQRKQHFKSQSIMGVRSETAQSNAIAFIHAPDGESWARFLQTKLSSDAYRIGSFSQPPHLEDISSLIASAQTCAVLVSPGLLDQEHNSFWDRCVEHFHHRTVILLLGTNTDDMRQNLGIPLCRRVLSNRWLEVDGSKEAVTSALVQLIQAYESVEGPSVERLYEDSAATGVELEEQGDKSKDDEDIYDYPPPARQHNRILRVIPTVLYEHNNREVLILTERDAEEPVIMVTESGCFPSRHISTEHITSSAYVAKIPDNLHGEIKFTLLAGEHNLGHASLCVYSRTDQLQHILKAETSPLALLSNSLGLPGDSKVAELDSVLAQRLKNCNFPADLMTVLTSEDQTTAAESANVQWPTLLHFAAEFNMAKVCEELLRFPGMIHAACMENKEGRFPCQLAEKNGYRDLQKHLVQYVEDTRLRRSAADSGISFSENMPPPQRHRSSSFSHYYVNSSVSEDDNGTFDNDYIDMSSCVSSPRGGLGEMQTLSTCREISDSEDTFTVEQSDHPVSPPPPVCHAKLHDGYAKPRSNSEGCIKIPFSARTPLGEKIPEEEVDSSEPPPLQPKRSKSLASECISSNFVPPVKRRPDSGDSQKSNSGDKEASENSSNPSPNSVSRLSAAGGAEEKVEAVSRESGWQLGPQSNSRPTSNASSSSSQSDYLLPAVTVPPPIQPEDSPRMRTKEGKRRMSVQDKISHFFSKIKSSSKRHQSASDGDLPSTSKGHKKPIVYTRQSTVSTTSDPSGYQSSSLRLKSQSSFGESERDSGAVCDEPGSPVLLRGKSKNSSTPRSSAKTLVRARAASQKRRLERNAYSAAPGQFRF